MSIELPKGFKLIFSCIAGSHLYGTNTENSDVDERGVFIPSKEYFLGFAHKVEQFENKTQDITYYDIRKFLALAIDSNPNIIELLFVPPNKINYASNEWHEIINHRELFLSKKARYTFSGYAVSQLKRIQLHRSWLLNPPKKQTTRSDFGLPEDRTLVTKEQLNAYIELDSQGKEMMLSIDVLRVLEREKVFQNANKHWDQYQTWKNTRNPDRAVLEEKHGYDTKFALHLVRLISEGEELLLQKHITFPRPDFEYLLNIKNGDLSYEQLMDKISDVDTKFDILMKKSTLPTKPDIKSIDELCVKLVSARI